ncbi:MAG: UDP-N-acetylmuramoyl-L-alanyl-D-glutamate--2,6-diaminopimelate ligase [bacterium]
MDKFKKIYHFLIAWFAYWYYGRVSKKLIVIGVTGTKGKSTACRFIASVLQAGGYKVGLLSTVDIQIGDRRVLNKDKMTMLGRGKIHKLLKQMLNAGCQYAVIETSSQGILQYRHLGLNYDVAVFTNLYPEHVEAHGGFENLKKDKAKIFACLNKNKKIINGRQIKKIIIVNGDDQNADYYLNFTADEKYQYGKKLENGPYSFLAEEVISDQAGSKFKVQGKDFQINLVGDFNVYNALSAVVVGHSQGIDRNKIAQGLKDVKQVEGRMQFIDQGQDFKVVVDYAHEPVSLTELFMALRNILKDTQGRLIAVVGSDGGGRDKGKREKMGEVAGRMTDIVIITDVNCYDEDPCQIANMLAVGARRAGKRENIDLFVQIDRKKAINKAITMARIGDVVVITAKGTEPCMAVAGGKKIPWDDREQARQAIAPL